MPSVASLAVKNKTAPAKTMASWIEILILLVGHHNCPAAILGHFELATRHFL